MTKQEMAQALKLAKSDTEIKDDFPSCMIGYGLSDFVPCYVTLENVAKMIRYQAQYLFGGWDTDEINGIANHGRRKFQIIG